MNFMPPVFRKTIHGVTASSMRDYFHRRYRPENIVFAATGNVDFDGMVADLESRIRARISTGQRGHAHTTSSKLHTLDAAQGRLCPFEPIAAPRVRGSFRALGTLGGGPKPAACLYLPPRGCTPRCRRSGGSAALGRAAIVVSPRFASC